MGFRLVPQATLRARSGAKKRRDTLILQGVYDIMRVTLYIYIDLNALAHPQIRNLRMCGSGDDIINISTNALGRKRMMKKQKAVSLLRQGALR